MINAMNKHVLVIPSYSMTDSGDITWELPDDAPDFPILHRTIDTTFMEVSEEELLLYTLKSDSNLFVSLTLEEFDEWRHPYER